MENCFKIRTRITFYDMISGSLDGRKNPSQIPTLGDQIVAGVPREKMLLNPKETQKEKLSDVYMICSTYSTLNKVSPPICIVSTSNHKKFEAML